MLETLVGGILYKADMNLLIGIAVVLLLISILSFVVKVLKLGILALVLSILLGLSIPTVSNLQEKYGFNFENNRLVVKVDGKEYKIDKSLCEEIVMESMGVSHYRLKAKFKDGNMEVNVPRFVVDIIDGFAKKMEIPVVIK